MNTLTILLASFANSSQDVPGMGFGTVPIGIVIIWLCVIFYKKSKGDLR